MDLDLNPRGNGACPLCRKERSCFIRKRLQNSLSDIINDRVENMQLVIYVCPNYEEIKAKGVEII